MFDALSIIGSISRLFISFFLEKVNVARREAIAIKTDASPKCIPGHFLAGSMRSQSVG